MASRKTTKQTSTSKTARKTPRKTSGGGRKTSTGTSRAKGGSGGKSTAKKSASKPKASPRNSGSKSTGKTGVKGGKSSAKKTSPKTSPKSPAKKTSPKTAKKTTAKKTTPASGARKTTSAKSGGRKTSSGGGAAPAPKRPRRKPSKAMLAEILERCDKALGAVRLMECSSVLERAAYLVLREQGTELTTAKAMKVLRDEFVDWNEVRVSRPSELSRLMAGSGKGAAVRRYHERAERMREMIDQIYNDRNETSLEFLVDERTKGRFEYLEDVDDLGLHNAYALVQWMSGETKLALVSKELAEAAARLGLIDSSSITKARAELSALASGEEQLVAMQAHLNQLGGMETTDWVPSIRELAV